MIEVIVVIVVIAVIVVIVVNVVIVVIVAMKSLKSKVLLSDSLTDWQGHLLSCPGQLKITRLLNRRVPALVVTQVHVLNRNQNTMFISYMSFSINMALG